MNGKKSKHIKRVLGEYKSSNENTIKPYNANPLVIGFQIEKLKKGFQQIVTIKN